jgi:hypothetical protein
MHVTNLSVQALFLRRLSPTSVSTTAQYLSPGEIATVTVPAAMVNAGFMIQVGVSLWYQDQMTKSVRHGVAKFARVSL